MAHNTITVLCFQGANVDKRTLASAERKQRTFSDRSQLKYARRLVVKLGSAVITREDANGLALGRLASIVEQVLVTKPDFYNEETRKHLFATLSELISLNIVPIINTNDAVSPPMFVHDDTVVPGTGKKGIGLKDNDSLSALLAAEVQADLLIMMSDVDGIYNKPPWEDGARILHTYSAKDKDTVEFGTKSKVMQYNKPPKKKN
ncbi:hypothetical protein MSG28_009818 [Choristoneura fumiferana]|uniref:Uncharacterized protein n=1 Tax=Choristoneura fumiferana TaxID=7141 RepID=A0ACC0JCR5_CHOFU|nr:hypothetical protein MSG28_009818 [Choristoneura fumiferana]